MRMRTMAAAVACLSAIGVCGCASSASSCGVGDNGLAGQRGFATPRQALRSELARHQQWLSLGGWVAASRAAHAVEFRSGNDSVDIVRRSDGEWVVGAVTACQ
jgi:hypothetical protein